MRVLDRSSQAARGRKQRPAPCAAAYILFVVAAVLLGAIPSPALWAAPALISLSPATGPAGTAVTLTGTIDTSNGTFTVRWDSPTGAVVRSGAATGVSVSTSFVVPPSPRGPHSVFLVDATSGGSSGPATFSAVPSIVLRPTFGPVGTLVSISGTGFVANETGIGVTWQNVDQDNITRTSAVAAGAAADAGGSWTTLFSVPAAAGGPHLVGAFGAGTPASLVPEAVFDIIAPRISISPVSGPVGTVVAVTGKTFGASETGITITYAGVAVASGITAGPGGALTATFVVPESPSGVTHAVSARGTMTLAGTVPDEAFSVTPAISVSPPTGGPGTVVTVRGTGFRAGETGIVVTLDGNRIAEGFGADSSGSWSRTLTLPPTATGARSIGAFGSITPATSVATVSFSVSPRITISPMSGTTGTVVSVTGTGFAAGETIVVNMDGRAVIRDIFSDASGRWSGTFTVPRGPGGSFTVSAGGNTTAESSVSPVTFNVGPRVSLSANSAVVGSEVTVNGRSFRSGESGISLTYDGAQLFSRIAANADGDWTAVFTVAPGASGAHRVQVSGSITAPASIPELTLSVLPMVTLAPGSGFAGTSITVAGTGFLASRPFNVTYDGAAQNTGAPAPMTDATGSFTVAFPAPRSRGGPHTVRVSDGVNTRETQFTMDSTPPAVPAILGPPPEERIGLFGGDDVTLTWSEVQDPSGVRYTLEVDSRPDFRLPLLHVPDLTTTSYRIIERLPAGPYYWRVRAVDGAFNESPWARSSFTMGIMPLWMFIALSIAAAVAVVVVLLAATRPKPVRWERRPARSRPGREA